MRSLALACVSALAGMALCAGAQASRGAIARPKLPLGHAGRWITDAQGRVVIVHGVNMVYKVAPYYPAATGFGDDDVAFLARMGFNAVRVGVIWKAVEPRPGAYDNSYLNHIAATVNVLARHGIVSLLDFHQDMYNERFQGEGAPDWAVQDDGLPPVPRRGFPGNYETMPALQHAYDHFWDNSSGQPNDSCAARSGEAGCRAGGKHEGVGLQDRYAAAWRRVARRFRGDRSVLGYELFNEPFPGTPYLTCIRPSGCPAFDAKLTAFNRRVNRAIRSVDRRTLVWYEPNVLFDYGFATNVGPLDDPQAGFSWHDYCLIGSPQGCPSNATTMANAARHVAHTHEATMMSEFGATTSTADLASMVALADRNMVPWLEWAYCGCSDPTGAGNLEAIVLDPSRPPTASNLVIPTLRTLVEPYPQLISGTPLSWGFTPSSKTFKLRYSPARAGGHGRFEPGAVTEIATPALVYAGDYAVRVKGGAIISEQGASTLEIAACRRARSISVTVSRSGRSHESCRPSRHLLPGGAIRAR
jgi:endoglycosylceramidase